VVNCFNIIPPYFLVLTVVLHLPVRIVTQHVPHQIFLDFKTFVAHGTLKWFSFSVKLFMTSSLTPFLFKKIDFYFNKLKFVFFLPLCKFFGANLAIKWALSRSMSLAHVYTKRYLQRKAGPTLLTNIRESILNVVLFLVRAQSGFCIDFLVTHLAFVREMKVGHDMEQFFPFFDFSKCLGN
jgi:hypothetical protein